MVGNWLRSCEPLLIEREPVTAHLVQAPLQDRIEKMQGTQNLAADAPVECQRDGFVVSTDRARLDLRSAHEFIAGSSYWAKQIPFETFARSAENSLCFGVYDSAGA